MKWIGIALIAVLLVCAVPGYQYLRSSKDAKATLSDEALQKTKVERRDIEKRWCACAAARSRRRSPRR